jgi:outer membrane protein TolC
MNSSVFGTPGMLFRSILYISIIFNSALFAGDEEKKVQRFTLKQAVQKVIETNLTVKNAKLEILKAESAYNKNFSKFAWTPYLEATISQARLPGNLNNIFSGTRQQTNKYALGVDKQFETGTNVKAEVSTVRFDSSAFENPLFSLGPTFQLLAAPPLYTGAFTLKISQELLKYSFGKTEQNTQKILKAESVVFRDNLIFQLINLVAKTLIDYWGLSVSEASVITLEKLVKNTKYIRDITRQKANLGTAENFEVAQWNAALSTAEANLEKAILTRDSSRRDLKRILGVEPDTEVTGLTDLSEEIPSDFDIQKDFDYAIYHRTDLINLKRTMEISKLKLSNAIDEDMPSLKVTATYSTLAQSFISPQDNYNTSNYNSLGTFKYHDVRGEVNMNYPLWDKGVKETIKESKAHVDLLKAQTENLQREIWTELENRYQSIKTSHAQLGIVKKTQSEAESYYKGVLAGYLQGRFNALAVKNALDVSTQAEFAVIQAKIGLNINLLQYDLTKNYLFEKFDVNVDKILEEMQKLQ